MAKLQTFLRLLSLIAILTFAAAQAQTTLTYQGRLDDGGVAMDGNVDLHFTLFDASTGGQQVGNSIFVGGVPVVDGLFQIDLDFGSAAFETSPLWLQVAVEGDVLTPRQQLKAAPYAINAINGGIETVLAGFGLTGGGTGDSVNLSVDSTLFQRRVSGSCSAGSSIRSISSFGGVTCEADDAGALTLPFSGSASTSLTGEVFEITNTGSGNAIVGRSSYEGSQTWIPAIYGVHESSTGPGDGVQGTSETTFNGSSGVRGRALGTSGQVYGVYGFARSPAGYGGRFVNNEGFGLFASGEGFDSGSGHLYSDLFLDRGTVSTDSGRFRLVIENTSPGGLHPVVFSIDMESNIGSNYFERLELHANGDLNIDGSLTQNSDRTAKHRIEPIDIQAILEQVATLPISTWRYNDDPDTLHIGPMAQDFHATFGLGNNPTGINAIDADGVALAAIQGLLERIESQQQRIETLEAELATRETRMARRIARLEILLTGNSLAGAQDESAPASP